MLTDCNLNGIGISASLNEAYLWALIAAAGPDRRGNMSR